jgi:hypothetical protein
MTRARLPTVLLASVAGLALVAALVLTNRRCGAATPTPTPVPAAITGNTSSGQAVRPANATTARLGWPDLLHGPGAARPDAVSERPDFLRSWLKDPRAVRPNTQMPDLGLKQAEIEALIAFLNSPDVSK